MNDELAEALLTLNKHKYAVAVGTWYVECQRWDDVNNLNDHEVYLAALDAKAPAEVFKGSSALLALAVYRRNAGTTARVDVFDFYVDFARGTLRNMALCWLFFMHEFTEEEIVAMATVLPQRPLTKQELLNLASEAKHHPVLWTLAATAPMHAAVDPPPPPLLPVRKMTLAQFTALFKAGANVPGINIIEAQLEAFDRMYDQWTLLSTYGMVQEFASREFNERLLRLACGRRFLYAETLLHVMRYNVRHAPKPRLQRMVDERVAFASVFGDNTPSKTIVGKFVQKDGDNAIRKRVSEFLFF